MRVSFSSAGVGRANEDFVGAVPDAVVLLDGAGIPGSEALCSHGVAWYTRRLGGALLGRLFDRDDLVTVLASAIDEVASFHRSSCAIADPSSPQATVAIVRVDGTRLDYLMLADSYLVLDGGAVVTDPREVAARRECAAPLAGIPVGTVEYDRVRSACVAEMRARRNQPGGYWIAKDDPRAASEAVTGTVSGVDAFALLSNGASRIVDPYGLTDWAGVLPLLAAAGPDELIRRVRAAEASDADRRPDDATVAHGTDLSADRGADRSP